MISGWLAASCQLRVIERYPFEDCGYERERVFLRGSPSTDAAPRLVGVPYHAPSVYGSVTAPAVRWFGVFDAPHGGLCLAYFRNSGPFVEPPTDMPGQDLFLVFDQDILFGLNSSRLSGGFSETEVAKSQHLGLCNCAHVYAGVRLLISAGELVARATFTKRAVPLAAAAE